MVSIICSFVISLYKYLMNWSLGFLYQIWIILNQTFEYRVSNDGWPSNPNSTDNIRINCNVDEAVNLLVYFQELLRMIVESEWILLAFDSIDQVIVVLFGFVSCRGKFLRSNLWRIHSNQLQFHNINSLNMDDHIIHNTRINRVGIFVNLFSCQRLLELIGFRWVKMFNIFTKQEST